MYVYVCMCAYVCLYIVHNTAFCTKYIVTFIVVVVLQDLLFYFSTVGGFL